MFELIHTDNNLNLIKLKNGEIINKTLNELRCRKRTLMNNKLKYKITKNGTTYAAQQSFAGYRLKAPGDVINMLINRGTLSGGGVIESKKESAED